MQNRSADFHGARGSIGVAAGFRTRKTTVVAPGVPGFGRCASAGVVVVAMIAGFTPLDVAGASIGATVDVAWPGGAMVVVVTVADDGGSEGSTGVAAVVAPIVVMPAEYGPGAVPPRT